MTDLATYYDESYPPELWGGVSNTNAPSGVGGSDVSATYPGIATLTDFGALEASGQYGNAGTAKPTAKFTAGQFVTVADGSKAHWDGTKWVAGAAPAAVEPPAAPPAPEPEPEPEPSDDEPSDDEPCEDDDPE